jgi:hypothetical protein
VFLRKVKTSDFYVEPFLRNKVKNVPVIVNQAPVKKETPKTKPETIPNKKPVVTTKPLPTQKPVAENKPRTIKPFTNTTPDKKPVIDSVQKTNIQTVKIPPPPVKTPNVLITRTNELVKVLTVNNQEVTVKFYDNGEIDGDTISVYLDKKLVLKSKGLTQTPLIVKFKIEDENEEHEMAMVAENLGRIPPNTSLMIVEAGEQRFDVRITSTEQKNAVVRFRYKKVN